VIDARLRSRAQVGLLAAAVCLGAAACGASSDPAATSAADPGGAPAEENKPSAERLCTAHCDRQQACGLAPESDCVTRCAPGQADNPHIRVDFAWHLLGCLDAIECPFVVEGRAFQVCHEATTRRLEITKPLRQFCFQSARKAAQCGRRDDANQGDCLDRYRYLKDEALTAGLACLAKPCAEVPGCFGSSFGLVR